jgi:hypothetical protein
MAFALQHANDGTIPQTNSDGLAIESHHVQILNNTIHDNSGHGIGGGGDYATISGNNIYANGNWSPYATGGVSQVQQGAQQFDNAPGYHNYISDNWIHDNVELIGNLAANGAITDGNGIIIDSNQLGATPYTGRTLISNNVLTDNGGAGVNVYQSAHVDVSSNTSVNNNLNVKEGEIEAGRSSDVNMSSNIMIARSGSYATGGGYLDTNVTYDYNFVAGPAPYGATPDGPHDILANTLFSEFGNWTPIGAARTANGYEIALENTGTGQYTVWTTDSNGNYTGSPIGVVSGNSYALESLEPAFKEDLNGDGLIGPPPTTVIQTDTSSFGSTDLATIGNTYFLYAVRSTIGPELQYNGSPVTSDWGGWSPIGAVKTASGYDVAWKLAGADEYTVWSTDNNGNYISNLIGHVSGTTTALESFELIFNQDLNADGVVGLYVAPSGTLEVTQALVGSSGAATIGAGAVLELTAADSATVVSGASTGILKLDQPSTFSGTIFGFTGDGTLAGSDQVDVKGINFSTVHDSYANGVLTVTDGTHGAALNFNGIYVLANFKLADDGSGGTIVYDPPVPGPSQGGTGTHVSTDARRAKPAGRFARTARPKCFLAQRSAARWRKTVSAIPTSTPLLCTASANTPSFHISTHR